MCSRGDRGASRGGWKKPPELGGKMHSPVSAGSGCGGETKTEAGGGAEARGASASESVVADNMRIPVPTCAWVSLGPALQTKRRCLCALHECLKNHQAELCETSAGRWWVLTLLEGGSETDGAWWWGAGARLLEDELYSSVQARLESLGDTEARDSQEDLNWHGGGASWSNYCVSPVGVSTPVNPSAGLSSQFDGGDDGVVGEDIGLRGIYPGPGPVPLPEALGSRGSEKWPEGRPQVVPPRTSVSFIF